MMSGRSSPRLKKSLGSPNGIVRRKRFRSESSSTDTDSDSIAAHVMARRNILPLGADPGFSTETDTARSTTDVTTEESTSPDFEESDPPPLRRSTRERKPIKFTSSESDEEIMIPKKPKRRRQQTSTSETIYSDLETEELEIVDPDIWVVQNILGERDKFSQHMENEEEEYEKEYYVKFHDRAYIHCKWMTETELLMTEGGESALKRFAGRAERAGLSHSLSIPSLMTCEEGDINSIWFKVDRVIDSSGDGDERTYCVKWQGLGYDEVTWEKAEDIKDEEKIQAYLERLDRSNPRKIPSRWRRPSPDMFTQVTEPVKSKDGNELRDYQMEGFNWLRFCWYNQRNNILADEMGLGKTAQVIAALNSLAQVEGITGPFLVVAPLSTLEHWKNEFERWSTLNAVVYHGNAKAREVIKETEIAVVDQNGRIMPDRVQFDVMITNNGTVFQDFPVFANIEWRYLIVDEAHSLKNAEGKLYQKMINLVFEHCTMLTGTPIQNNVKELWGLLHFLYPQKFADAAEFDEMYGNTSDASQIAEIQNIIQPIMLRRKKADVEMSILPKVETIVQVELTRTQKKYYRAFLQENKATLLQHITGGALVSLQNLMMQLRKLCNHPYLIKGAENQIIREMKEQFQGTLRRQEIELKAMIESSGKMIFVDKLLPKLRAGGNKVLIFSQMVRILDILEEYLVERGYPFERIDGSVSENDRPRAIERFNEDPNSFVFLLSTKAAGVGINLTAANTVIIYDSDWNPQNDIQAQARCHRIGQKDEVKVYRLITRDTYESKMFERASRKLGLDHVILDGGEMAKDAKPKKAAEIEEILRHGVHGIFNDDDTEADNFCAADIDQILEKRATSTTDDIITGGGSKFARAIFNTDDNQLDMNSTDFWSKVMPLDQESETGISIRRCRQERMEKAFVEEMQAGTCIKRCLQNLIDCGYRARDNEASIIEFALSFVDVPTKRWRDLLLGIMGKRIPEHEEDEADLEKDMEEENQEFQTRIGDNNSSLIEEKAEKVIERVIFFARLRRMLMFVQRSDIEWPSILPVWENPVAEYSLAFAVDKYGWRDLGPHIGDPEVGLAGAAPLKKSQIGNRLDDLISSFEDQIPDDMPNPPDSFEPDIPEKWSSDHPTVLSRNLLFDHEIFSEFQALCAIGIPVNENGEQDWSEIRRLARLPLVTLEAVQTVGEEIVKMAENTNDEIKWDDYPLLNPVKDEIDIKAVKRLQGVLKDLTVIRNFTGDLNPEKLELLKDVERPAVGPEWWNWECDQALILSLDKYGLNKIATWLVDPTLPFRQHLPVDIVEALIKAAEQEQKRNRKVTLGVELSEDIAFLSRERSRVSRALSVIKAVNASIEKTAKAQEREASLLAKKQEREEQKRKKQEERELERQRKQEEREEQKRKKQEERELEKQRKQEERDLEKQRKQEERRVKSDGKRPILTLRTETAKHVSGLTKMPWQVAKTLKVMSLGAFETPVKHHMLWSFPTPVGFCSVRTYQAPGWSGTLDFQSEIVKSDGGLLFKVTILNEPQAVFAGDTPTIPWTRALKEGAARMGVSSDDIETAQSGKKKSGSTMFGLTSQSVLREMLKLPNAHRIPALTSFMKKQCRQGVAQWFAVDVIVPQFQLADCVL